MNHGKNRHPVSGIDENGHPYSCGGLGFGGRPQGRDEYLLDNLTTLEREIVLLWIEERLRPRKTFNDRYTSYGLKHRLEDDTGIYVSNNAFKDAMLRCGYVPRDEHELNWEYAISQRSPALRFDQYRRYRRLWLVERDPVLARKLYEEYSSSSSSE